MENFVGNTELTNVIVPLTTDTITKPKIQRVPPILPGIEANKKCYDPLVVSIGPFHHEKVLEIKEEYKWAMALQYADNNVQLLHDLCNKVKAVAEDARNYYSEGSTDGFDEEKFTKMMFLDGCFILQFIHCYVNDNLKMKTRLAAFVKQDLLLLENQLPFLVLTELMSLRFNEVEWKKTFSRFIAPFRGFQDDMEIQFDQCAHLLDMIHTMLINKAALTRVWRKGQMLWPGFRSIRSIKKLKVNGIRVGASESHQWTDVQFRPTLLEGLLKLPPIYIDDSTKSMLLNMIAYEACPDAQDDLGVSSYICIMDSIIDHVDDVEELQSKGILLNFLGSDQQVVDLFHEMAENLVFNPYIYADVLIGIQNHYKNKMKIWYANWVNINFSSPLTAGALVALMLSFIQAIGSYFEIYKSLTEKPNP